MGDIFSKVPNLSELERQRKTNLENITKAIENEEYEDMRESKKVEIPEQIRRDYFKIFSENIDKHTLYSDNIDTNYIFYGKKIAKLI